MRLWDVYTGRQICVWEFKAPARAVSFSHGSQKAVCVTDAAMGQPSTIHFLDIPRRIRSTTHAIVISDSKATIVKWGPLNRHLYTGHEDGAIAIYDANTCKKLKSVKLHTAMIQDLQFAPVDDLGFFISASKDNSSMIYETATLKVLKTFSTQRPVNSACISPLRNHIILGGGQEAMNVTTTSQRHEKFEVRFFHSIFEDEIARCKGHFGPINTLAWSPDGKRYIFPLNTCLALQVVEKTATFVCIISTKTTLTLDTRKRTSPWKWTFEKYKLHSSLVYASIYALLSWLLSTSWTFSFVAVSLCKTHFFFSWWYTWQT